MKIDLSGKVAIVTGGSRGIGKASAIALADAGAKVVVNYSKNKGSADEVVKTIKEKGGDAFSYQAKVEKLNEVEKMISEAEKKYERIDILVNNAGLMSNRFLMIMGEEEWKQVIDTNLTGVYNCCKAVSRIMIGQKSGKIINISSVSSTRGTPGQTNYAASKAGVEGFTRALSKEVSNYGININSIAPGMIETDMAEKLRDDIIKESLKRIPLGRFGKPEEIARVVVFLASDNASYIQGQTIYVDGGINS